MNVKKCIFYRIKAHASNNRRRRRRSYSSTNNKKKKNQSINKNTSTNPTNNHPRLLKQITQLKIKKNLQNTKVIARHPTNYDNLNNS